MPGPPILTKDPPAHQGRDRGTHLNVLLARHEDEDVPGGPRQMHLEGLLHRGLHIVFLWGLQASQEHRQRTYGSGPLWEPAAQSLVWGQSWADSRGCAHADGPYGPPGSQASTPKKQSNQMSPEYSLSPPSPKAVGSHGAHKTFPRSVPSSHAPYPALHLRSGSVKKKGPWYLAEENVHREGTSRDVEDGDVPKKGGKFLCVHGG